jgi:hypothetical protein
LFASQFATHVVTSPPALVEPAAQAVHVPSLRYWFSEHDCSASTASTATTIVSAMRMPPARLDAPRITPRACLKKNE